MLEGMKASEIKAADGMREQIRAERDLRALAAKLEGFGKWTIDGSTWDCGMGYGRYTGRAFATVRVSADVQMRVIVNGYAGGGSVVVKVRATSPEQRGTREHTYTMERCQKLTMRALLDAFRDLAEDAAEYVGS